jgi:lipid-binding SYLF domain-containing protein
MMRKLASGFIFFIALLIINSTAANAAESKSQQRAEIRKSSQEILKNLYRANPSARGAIKSAAGYATFSNFGMKIFFAGGGSGSGLAVNNATKKVVFMKMIEVQAGLGLGIKKFNVVFVFDTVTALENFIDSGWEFGGQTTAAASNGERGGSFQGAVSVMPGVWMYQMTDKGLALEATGKGTKYYKNDDLN